MSNLLLARNALMARHPLLPREYQQVEYIESTGTQWIDTGVIPVVTSAYTIQTRFCPTNISGEQYVIATDFNNSSGNRKSRLTCVGWYQGRFLFGWCNWSQGISLSINEWYDISESFSNGNQSINLNNFHYSANWTQTATFLSTIKIGGAKGQSQYNSFAKIGNTKIIVDGAPVRDFIPCYKKSNSEAGMFDIVNHRFYSSVASPFLYGPETL